MFTFKLVSREYINVTVKIIFGSVMLWMPQGLAGCQVRIYKYRTGFNSFGLIQTNLSCQGLRLPKWVTLAPAKLSPLVMQAPWHLVSTVVEFSVIFRGVTGSNPGRIEQIFMWMNNLTQSPLVVAIRTMPFLSLWKAKRLIDQRWKTATLAWRRGRTVRQKLYRRNEAAHRWLRAPGRWPSLPDKSGGGNRGGSGFGKSH